MSGRAQPVAGCRRGWPPAVTARPLCETRQNRRFCAGASRPLLTTRARVRSATSCLDEVRLDAGVCREERILLALHCKSPGFLVLFPPDWRVVIA